MKTSEFIEKVEELGFIVNNYEVALCIFTEDGNKVAQVSKKIERSMTTRSFSFVRLSKEESEELFNLLVEYASTPLEERNEEKKYHVRMKNIEGKHNYLLFNRQFFYFYIGNNYGSGKIKSVFTEKEIPIWANELIEAGYLIKEEVKYG